MTSQLRALRIALILSVLLVIGVGVALSFSPETIESRLARGDADLGGNFTLQSVNGPIELTDYHGNTVVLYFGYTYCPDMCPAALAKLGVALRHLPKPLQQKTQGIFISVDPQRDTIERLAQYTRVFSDKIIGATADPDTIREIAGRYGVFYHRVNLDADTKEYFIDHTSQFYLIDSNGQLIDTLPQNVSSTVLLNRLVQMAAEEN